VPVVKVATNSELARRWHDLMDLNAGRIADGEASIEDTGMALFRLLLGGGERQAHLGGNPPSRQRPGAVQSGPVT
jgi:altronate dehydratase